MTDVPVWSNLLV